MGLVVSVDRMERGTGEVSALQEIENEFGIRTCSIVSMKDVIECLYNRECEGRVIIDDALMERIDAYYEQYGVR